MNPKSKPMRRFLLFSLLFVLAHLVLAQQQQYSGRLVDAETGEPMAFANLYVAAGRGALTNLDGQYTLVATPDEEVRISFVGYSTLTLRAADLKPLLQMQPLSQRLNEVTVLSTDAILMRVRDQLRSDFSKHQRRQSHYFCRMTFLKDEQTEMVEAFLEANSAVNLRNLGVTNGQYWAKSPTGRIQSNLRNTNLHVNYTLGPMIRGNELWKDVLIVPFPEEGREKYLHDHYEVAQTTLSGRGDRTIYAITLTPKEQRRNRPILGGTLYVDAETLHLLRFDGTIYAVKAAATYGVQKERTTLDIAVKINYRHKNGFTEVNDISSSALNDEVQCHTVLTNVEDYHLPLTYGEKIGHNLLSAIERAGTNPEVESRYTFIPRTHEEIAVASSSASSSESTAATDRPVPASSSESHPADEGEALLSRLEHLTDTIGPLAYIQKAMRFGQAYPQEKVYLHLDNTGYFKGETIWFKAYVTRTDEESRTDLSKVLYVELLSPSGDVVERRKLPIRNGEAYGDIRVDSILLTGFYELRAYTRAMTNWGTQACYSRVIPIFRAPAREGDYTQPSIDRLSYRHRLNNERQTSADVANGNIVVLDADGQEQASDPEKKRAFNVHFYPEGGALVQGLPSRVAFTATDRDGAPLALVGYLADEDGTRRGDISTDAEGRGLFTLPADNVATKAIVRRADEGGEERVFMLPEALPSGCTMTVDALADDRISADLYCSPSLVGQQLGYVVMHGGKIVRCDTLTARPHHSLTFVRQYLPTGVSQLTLFDAQGRILSERLFFIIPPATAADSISVSSVNEHLTACGKVAFDLQAAPNATLSFSAIDAAGMVNGNYGNMRTWLLLGSEVKGYIHRPERYLEADDEAHRRMADLLMLVQGWRRYDWQLMSGQATWAKHQPVEDRLFLFGEVKGAKKKLDVEGVDVTAHFYNAGGQSFSATTTTTELGQYGFALPNIGGEWNLQLQAQKGDVPEAYVVGIDRHFSPAPRYLSPQEMQVLPVEEDRAFRWSIPAEDTVKWVSITKKDHLLKNVTVKAKRRVWDRTGWNDETSARHLSMIFYDCDEASDRIADEGEPDPGFCEWLKGKNNLFGGEAVADNVLIGRPMNASDDSFRKSGRNTHVLFDIDDFLALNPEGGEAASWRMAPPGGFIRFYGDGLTYKGRPIVWVVDNQFCTITNFRLRRDGELSRSMKSITAMFVSVNHTDNRSNANIELPLWLEDVKAVYISENTEGLHQHLYIDEVDYQNPVVIYCYTHRRLQQKEKGVRYTHYQGFNVPSTFEMEDYSIVPPVEDFRRTLYWNPNVKLDRRGHATVEFYNNSSCTEMFVSAEGMTPEGKPLSAY